MTKMWGWVYDPKAQIVPEEIKRKIERRAEPLITELKKEHLK